MHGRVPWVSSFTVPERTVDLPYRFLDGALALGRHSCRKELRCGVKVLNKSLVSISMWCKDFPLTDTTRLTESWGASNSRADTGLNVLSFPSFPRMPWEPRGQSPGSWGFLWWWFYFVLPT